jgi:hypothetical protein
MLLKLQWLSYPPSLLTWMWSSSQLRVPSPNGKLFCVFHEGVHYGAGILPPTSLFYDHIPFHLQPILQRLFFFSCDLPTLDAQRMVLWGWFPQAHAGRLTLQNGRPDMAQLQTHNYAEKKQRKRTSTRWHVRQLQVEIVSLFTPHGICSSQVICSLPINCCHLSPKNTSQVGSRYLKPYRGFFFSFFFPFKTLQNFTHKTHHRFRKCTKVLKTRENLKDVWFWFWFPFFRAWNLGGAENREETRPLSYPRYKISKPIMRKCVVVFWVFLVHLPIFIMISKCQKLDRWEKNSSFARSPLSTPKKGK